MPHASLKVFDELPAKVANRLLSGLSPQARQNTNVVLGYPDESVGRQMSPRYANVRASMTGADALAKVRRAGLRSREVLVLPVTDDQGRLVGLLTPENVGEVLSPPLVNVAEPSVTEPAPASEPML